MSKILKKRSGKAFLPPGSLVHIGNFAEEEIEISLYDYGPDQLIVKERATVEDCLILMETPSTTWIHIKGIHDLKMIENFGKHFRLHPLVLEDIANSGQRSKMDNYKDTIYIVLRLLRYNKKLGEVEDDQISIILGKNYVISFAERASEVFQGIPDRLKNPNSRLKKNGADYLCYALIDSVVDNYFLILECVDDKLSALEQELTDSPDPSVLKKIQGAKKEIILLRKSVWPVRDVVNQFKKLETPLIKEATRIYMQDVYDHTIQAIDTIESFRDITSGMLDLYLSNISFRMNEIMKVLTIVATIFVPLTFIASVYGMNFEYMPGLHTLAGYYCVMSSMGFISLGMIYFFYKKNWL